MGVKMVWMVGALTLFLGACVERSVDSGTENLGSGNETKIPLPYTIVEPGVERLDSNSMAIYSLFLKDEEGLAMLVRDSTVDCKAALQSSLLSERLTIFLGQDSLIAQDSRWRSLSEAELLAMQSQSDSIAVLPIDLKPIQLTEKYEYAYAVKKEARDTVKYLGVRESFPGYSSILSFGRIVYSTQQDLAVLYVESYGGPLAGSRIVYLLEKKEGEWLISTSVLLTVS